MERNENGYPRTLPAEDNEISGHGDMNGMLLGYSYVPIQHYRMLFSPEDALSHGTLFEELYKPLGVYGNE